MVNNKQTHTILNICSWLIKANKTFAFEFLTSKKKKFNNFWI